MPLKLKIARWPISSSFHRLTDEQTQHACRHRQHQREHKSERQRKPPSKAKPSAFGTSSWRA